MAGKLVFNKFRNVYIIPLFIQTYVIKALSLEKNQKLEKLMAEIKEAKKDPQFRRELRQFIKTTTS